MSVCVYSWYPGVINVFADKNNFTGIKPENMESFYNSVTTLVSNQVHTAGRWWSSS